MEPLNFTFKKSRGIGDLLQDFISLFKKIFKHYNGLILSLALPFLAIAILITFYFSRFVTAALSSNEMLFASGTFSIFLSVSVLFFLLIFLIISCFGIEYMLLLEEKGNTQFTTKDIYRNIKKNLSKYITFFFASIVVVLIFAIPLMLIYVILAFIPVIGNLAMGVVSACFGLFLYCALFLYLQDREELWESYKASFYLLKSKIFAYGAAAYIFQMLAQILLLLLTLVPLIILAIIGFTTVGFDARFFESFLGKFLFSIGSSLFFLFFMISTIYLIGFYMLQYFSLLESSYKEDTLETIDQIGGTEDEL